MPAHEQQRGEGEEKAAPTYSEQQPQEAQPLGPPAHPLFPRPATAAVDDEDVDGGPTGIPPGYLSSPVSSSNIVLGRLTPEVHGGQQAAARTGPSLDAVSSSALVPLEKSLEGTLSLGSGELVSSSAWMASGAAAQAAGVGPTPPGTMFRSSAQGPPPGQLQTEHFRHLVLRLR